MIGNILYLDYRVNTFYSLFVRTNKTSPLHYNLWENYFKSISMMLHCSKQNEIDMYGWCALLYVYILDYGLCSILRSFTCKKIFQLKNKLWMIISDSASSVVECILKFRYNFHGNTVYEFYCSYTWLHEIIRTHYRLWAAIVENWFYLRYLLFKLFRFIYDFIVWEYT